MRITLAVLFAGGLLLGFGAAEAVCQEQVVLRVLPTSFISSSSDTTFRTVIGESERQQNALLIVKRDGRYFWATREDRELTIIRSGLFDYFIDIRGGGYVKVLDQRAFASSPLYDGGLIQFFEHVSLGIGTLTYWGKAERYNP